MGKAKVTKKTVASKYLTPVMREYVKSAYEHVCNTETEEFPSRKDVVNAIAQKLYEDILIEVKNEGFAQYCAFTAVEVLNGMHEDFDAVQDDLDIIQDDLECMEL